MAEEIRKQTALGDNVEVDCSSRDEKALPQTWRFGLESTVRPSLAFYNTCADVDALINVLYRLRAGR